jgi:N-acetyl-beta-hexosaminidase
VIIAGACTVKDRRQKTEGRRQDTEGGDVRQARGVVIFVLWFVVSLTVGCARVPKPKGPQALAPSAAIRAVLPAPARIEPTHGDAFTVGPDTVIALSSPDPAVTRVAQALATLVQHTIGARPRVDQQAPATAASIALSIDGTLGTGEEGYDLTIQKAGVSLRARTPAGLFYGVQTIRQLLPYWGEYEAINFQRPTPVPLPALHIVDAPRFPWRGAMLDVARHFFTVNEVKRFIDSLALVKMNRLHLGLGNDQGWRIEIKSRPNLTRVGAATEVGGGPGGFYTQAQYADLVAYAADRFVTIVPEIDMPGHTNAALASYAELNCDGVAPPPYTGTDVGFSVFCVDRDTTYQFIDQIVEEIAGLTPGPYFHAGGDEVKKLTPEQYRAFVERVQQIVSAHGKQMVGWDEIAAAPLLPSTIVQHWRPEAPAPQLLRAPHLILSPGNRAYLDMRYSPATAIGLNWAGFVSVRQAYDWDPDRLVPGSRPDAILGIEAPLWSETIVNIRDAEYLAFPRLAALADLAWSPAASHDWRAFRARLGEQAPRWTALGINFYRTREIVWRDR